MYNKVSTAIKETENTVKLYTFYLNILMCSEFFSVVCPFLHLTIYYQHRAILIEGDLSSMFFPFHE